MSGGSGFPHLWLEGANEEHPIRTDLGRPFVAGRSQDADLKLADSGCSRQQFQVSSRDGRWWIQALSATVPTLVNQRPLQSPAALAHGDYVECGATRLRFVERADAARRASLVPAPTSSAATVFYDLCDYGRRYTTRQSDRSRRHTGAGPQS